MIAARAALAGAAMLLAFVLGWIFTPAPSAMATATGSVRLATLRLDPPGASAAAAAAELARLHGAATPPTAPRIAVAAPKALVAPPPPPPRPETVLRSELAAVEGREGDLRLVLTGARRLKTGDAYMGWRLAALSRTSAMLSRGGERRTVDFFAPASPSPGAAAATRLAAPAVEGSRAVPSAAEFFSGFKG